MRRRILVLCGLFVCVCAYVDGGKYNIADINEDGIVDGKDLGILSKNWLERTVSARPDIEFARIPGGTFQMGDESGGGGFNEKPRHTITLNAYDMSKYEVTNKQYALFLNEAKLDGLIKVVDGAVYAAMDMENEEPWLATMSASASSYISYIGGVFSAATWLGRSMEDYPVTNVTWYGSKAFCEYFGWRLPTEAEWEYAARGGHHNPYYMYPWGSNSIDATKLNYDESSIPAPRTTPVGDYPAYGYGLHDMAGNVYEWCSDWYDDYYYEVSPRSNPQGPEDGAFKVLRGGYYLTTANGCRVAYRYKRPPDSYDSYGFRCVWDRVPSVSVGKDLFSTGEVVTVSFNNASESATDWIGLYKAGATNTDVLVWKRTDGTSKGTPGITEGSVTLGTVMEAGEYEVRLFFRASYNVEAFASFMVSDAG